MAFVKASGFLSTFTRHFATSPATNSRPVLLSHSIFEPTVKVEIPPLLITHGLLGSKQNWTSIAKAISKRTPRKVITFDARNHGDSPHSSEMNHSVMMEDIKYLADYLSLPKFSLLGHSMGGLTSMAFSLKCPEYIEKLIIVDIAPTVLGGSEFSGNEHYIRALLEAEFPSREVTLSNVRKVLDKTLEMKVKDKAVRAFLLTNLAHDSQGRVYWKPNLPILLHSLKQIREFPSDLKEKTFAKSALFIRGGKSTYVPDELVPEIKNVFPHAEIATMENSSHWCHADNPTEFLSIAVKFLQN